MSNGGMGRWWGPVFEAERKTRARRWQGYASRSAFVLALLGGLVLVYVNLADESGVVTVAEMARTGVTAYSTLTSLELLAVLLIAPAATAGAICLDKTRGTLAHVFVTDLSDREIVLGKLAARLLPVWGLLACALPVSAMATLLGGIDPVALTGAFIIALGVAILGCSLALMLSVWASKPHDVISVVFGVWAVWLFACPVWSITYWMRSPAWLEWTNPFSLAFLPYTHPDEASLIKPILFSLGCGLIGAGLTVVAVRMVRVVGCRSTEVRTRKVGRIGRGLIQIRGPMVWGRGPNLDANPVLWREWHRNKPSRWSRYVWLGFEVISAVSGIGLIVEALNGKRTPLNELAGVLVGLLSTLGLLLVSAATASVLAEERTRGSLDVLLSTPISTRAILQAKWRGAFRRIPWLVVWPVVVGVVTAIAFDLGGTAWSIIFAVPVLIMAQGAALVSLGLALATWIKRTGQATAWTNAVFVVSLVGWPTVGVLFPLVEQGSVPPTDFDYAVGIWTVPMGSPFFNIGFSLLFSFISKREPIINLGAMLTIVIAWTLIYGLVALGLFESTVRTFDRCLGRMPERASTPRLEPGKGDQPGRSRFKVWGWRTPFLERSRLHPAARSATLGKVDQG